MKIEWDKIKTAHGTAKEIPNALERLKSESIEDREIGYWKIDNHAVLQSDLYEAAYYVIEPLIKILNEANGNEIINLLIEIALGYVREDIEIKIHRKNMPLKDACDNELKKYKKEIENIMKKTANEKTKYWAEYLINIIDNNDSALDAMGAAPE